MRVQLKKVAIVGANGFIGRALTCYLEDAGIKVVPFFSSQPIVTETRLNENLQGVSAVIWCASRVNPISAESRSDLVEIEFSEWQTFLNAWQKESSENMRILYLSSGGCTYTEEKSPFQELSEANGINAYGRLKVRMEREILSTKHPFTILRVSNVYGPGQPHGRGQGVIAEWLHAIKNRNNFCVYGSLESFRDYLYIDDLCEGILRTLNLKSGQHTLNLGSGIPTKLKEILDIFTTIKSNDTKIKLLEGRPTDRSGYYLDISKLEALTGWKPLFTIQSGIHQAFEVGNERK